MQDHWSHDIRDPEAFVGRIVDRSRRTLDYHQRERLHQFLLIELWNLSLDFRPGGIKFSTWAGNTLPRRIIDWERTPEEGGRVTWTFSESSTINVGYRGKTIERERPRFAEFDDDSLGATAVDSTERLASDRERVATERTISAAAYFPPRGLFPGRRTQWAPSPEAGRKAA